MPSTSPTSQSLPVSFTVACPRFDPAGRVRRSAGYLHEWKHERRRYIAAPPDDFLPARVEALQRAVQAVPIGEIQHDAARQDRAAATGAAAPAPLRAMASMVFHGIDTLIAITGFRLGAAQAGRESAAPAALPVRLAQPPCKSGEPSAAAGEEILISVRRSAGSGNSARSRAGAKAVEMPGPSPPSQLPSSFCVSASRLTCVSFQASHAFTSA